MAIVMPVPSKIESCSQKDVEVHLKEIFVVSAAKSQLPLQIEDAARPIGEVDETVLNVRVNQDTRLDNRVLDLRTPANQAIFKVEAGVCKLFRDILTRKVSIIDGISDVFSEMFSFISFILFRALSRFTLLKLFLQPVRVERTYLQCLILKAMLT